MAPIYAPYMVLALSRLPQVAVVVASVISGVSHSVACVIESD